MRINFPILLWSLVLVMGATVSVYLFTRPDVADVETPEAADSTEMPAGVAIVDVPWKHLPNVSRFKLTDQNGDEFDSGQLMGEKPFVVSFFFADCPTFCRDLNKTLERASAALKDTDVQFLTISVWPERDTPEVLNKYAEGFGAKPDRWAFLTGQLYLIKQVGEHMFNVVVDRDTHTDNILLVDKWGHYRDRFKWDQPEDMKRFVKVVKEVAAETSPPMEGVVRTRNVMAGVEPKNLGLVPWIRDFHLTERSGKKFFSRDLVGEVWVGNFFFSTCPGICVRQNEYLRNIQSRLKEKFPKVVSISTDAATDTPERLREFADSMNADPNQWLFCTGDSVLTKRIGSEFFRAPANDDHHSSLLFVVDRWGDVRGSFDWQEPAQEIKMLELIDQLKQETQPPKPTDDSPAAFGDENSTNDQGEEDEA